MTLREQIVDGLAEAGGPLDDDELALRIGVARQAVNQACRALAGEGRIDREPGAAGKLVNRLVPTGRRSVATSTGPSVHTAAAAFETRAREAMSVQTGAKLAPGKVTLSGGVEHAFDLVSPDGRVVGDAKYYTDLKPIPAAKLSVISEYVWLLQHAERAERRVLVFGHDRAVPLRWLKRFRPLLGGVEFWFLDEAPERLA